MAVSGEDLYNVVIFGSAEDKLATLSDLKAHVKKDNVNMDYVPKYFESLSIAVDTADTALHTLTFGLVCHLVKRVSIQDAKGKVLLDQSFLVLPIIIPKIADAKSSVKLSARRALEAYWLSAPEKVEQALIDVGLTNRSSLVVNESVVWLNHILTTINPHFKLDAFFAPLAKVLAVHEGNKALVDNIKVLFANYYDLKQNRLHKFELQKVLDAHRVSSALQTSIMGIDTILSQEQKPVLAKKPSLASFPERPRSSEHTIKQALPKETPLASADSNSQPDLDSLLASLPNYQFDHSMSPASTYDAASLQQTVTDMLPCFEGKETERNWGAREKSIVSLRSLLRGNAGSSLAQEFLQCIHEIYDGICKGLTSLRTSLCIASCQFVKELAIHYGSSFDALAEMFLPTLIRLCSATKHLTTLNANVAVCSIFSNCSLSSKFTQRIVHASMDKSANTRSYAPFWLLIFVVRNHNSWSAASTDSASRVLLKLLPDPNLQVRLAAKESYWKYHSILPEQATALLARLDQNTVKAIERSRPAGVRRAGSAPPVTTQRSRPSIKEAIIAKNRELRSKQNASRSASRNSLRPREADPEIVTISEPPSVVPHKAEHSLALSHKSLPEPHYAQSTYSQRSSNSMGTTRLRPSPQPSLGHIRSTPPASSPLAPEIEKKDTVDSYDQRRDPIVTFLSSTHEESVREGINLLRYAIIADEDLPKEISTLLRKISVTNPALLKPLFTDGEKLFNKTKKYFSNNDFVRVCSILVAPTELNVDLLIQVLGGSELYHSIAVILSYVANLENIANEKLLVMQVIKTKSKILDMLVNVLNIAIPKVQLADENFSKVVSNLIDLMPVVHQTSTSETYKNLLRKLYEIDSALFLTHLAQASKASKRGIEHLLDIDNAPEMTTHDGTVYNAGELTQIAPGKGFAGLSPLKQPSDFTMLLPLRRNGPGSSVPHKDADVVKEVEIMEKPITHQAKESENSISVHDDLSPMADVEEDNDILMEDADSTAVMEKGVGQINPSKASSVEPVDLNLVDRDETPYDVFSQSDLHGSKTDFFAKLHSDSSTELVDDFALVKLACPANTIESFINKVDPLNKISNKNRIISIFGDTQAGSPQKVREYSYTDLNWFNFLMARLSLDNEENHFDHSVEDFRGLCSDLLSSKLEYSGFVSLLRYLQVHQSDEFNDFFNYKGKDLLELSLWQYLPSSSRTGNLYLLMIIKQLLISRVAIKLLSFWEVLMQLSGSDLSDAFREMEYAMAEAFDEALCGLYSSFEVLQTVLASLRRKDELAPTSLKFAVQSLNKLMSLSTLALIISDELVHQVDGVLRSLLGHREAEVRKNVFQAYGKILRATNAGYSDNNLKVALFGPQGCGSMRDVMLSLSGPQRKMMEYFSR